VRIKRGRTSRDTKTSEGKGEGWRKGEIRRGMEREGGRERERERTGKDRLCTQTSHNRQNQKT
jgi:hypothetical protein